MELKSADAVAALNIVRLAIERRNTLPILNCFLLERFDGGRVRMRGSNLDQQITVEIEAQAWSNVEKAAAVHSPIALRALIANMGSNRVTLAHDAKNGKLALSGGDFRGSMNTLPADDFPAERHADDALFACEFGADTLDTIFRVSKAMSREETRYYLNGIYIHHAGGWDYNFACTDGHRLHRATVALPNSTGEVSNPGGGNGNGVIIPRAAIDMLKTLRPKLSKDAPIRMSLRAAGPPPNTVETLAPDAPKTLRTPSRAVFELVCAGRPVELVTKLIDSTFPDYTRVIPAFGEDHNAVTFRREDLYRALRAMTAGMTEKTRAVKLIFDPKGALAVTTKWIDVGFEGRMDIPAKVRTSPGAIVDPEASNFISVLMPMRV
jgi:DNA polymerase-3 subunit beta